ncbi:MAG: ribbon-helix-helix domain-containing protein [Nitrospiraceae bacterium]|nr:ribbon-helix-helix domain-containing protein [Nitrospiraceae bacterium]
MRMHVILPKPQFDAMVRLSTRTGITVSEHVRRALDHYLVPTVEAARAAKKSP